MWSLLENSPICTKHRSQNCITNNLKSHGRQTSDKDQRLVVTLKILCWTQEFRLSGKNAGGRTGKKFPWKLMFCWDCFKLWLQKQLQDKAETAGDWEQDWRRQSDTCDNEWTHVNRAFLSLRSSASGGSVQSERKRSCRGDPETAAGGRRGPGPVWIWFMYSGQFDQAVPQRPSRGSSQHKSPASTDTPLPWWGELHRPVWVPNVCL